MGIDLEIQCPSCYRKGVETFLFPNKAHVIFPGGGDQYIYVYACRCGYKVTQHEFLYHEYRARYNRALSLTYNIRGWSRSMFNSPPGKVWVIHSAVQKFLEDMGLGESIQQ